MKLECHSISGNYDDGKVVMESIVRQIRDAEARRFKPRMIILNEASYVHLLAHLQEMLRFSTGLDITSRAKVMGLPVYADSRESGGLRVEVLSEKLEIRD